MVTLEARGYFEMLQNSYEASYIFIADPDGNVLHDVEVNRYNDGVLKLLPPEDLEGGAPDSYSFTLGTKSTYNGEETFYLTTFTGLEPWKPIYRSGSISSEVNATKKLTMEMEGLAGSPMMATFATDYGWSFWDGIDNDPWHYTFEYEADMDNLLIRYEPDPNAEQSAPLFKYVENISDLADDDRLIYNVSEEFTEMIPAGISLANNVILQDSYYQMSVQPETWDQGTFYLPSLTTDYEEINRNKELAFYLPDVQGHLFDMYMSGIDQSDDNIRYYNYTYTELPSQFVALDASIDIQNASLNDLQMSISGDFLFGSVYMEHHEENDFYNRWDINFADTTQSLVFPKIADYIDQSLTNFSRSGFEISSAYLHNIDSFENYEGFLNYRFYDKNKASFGNQHSKIFYLNSYNAKRKAAKAQGSHLVKPVQLFDNPRSNNQLHQKSHPNIPYRH